MRSQHWAAASRGNVPVSRGRLHEHEEHQQRDAGCAGRGARACSCCSMRHARRGWRDHHRTPFPVQYFNSYGLTVGKTGRLQCYCINLLASAGPSALFTQMFWVPSGNKPLPTTQSPLCSVSPPSLARMCVRVCVCVCARVCRATWARALCWRRRGTTVVAGAGSRATFPCVGLDSSLQRRRDSDVRWLRPRTCDQYDLAGHA